MAYPRRVVSGGFWEDDYIGSLPPKEKLLFIYLLTSPRSNLAGVYELKMRPLMFDTGLTAEEISAGFEKFAAAGKVYYEKETVIIVNFTKHQSYNKNMLRGVESILKGFESILNGSKGFEKVKEAFGRVRNYSEEVEVEVEDNIYNINNNTKQEAEKREKPVKKPAASPVYTQGDYDFVQFMERELRFNNPKMRKPNLFRWAEEIRLMRERDKRTFEEIKAVFLFANNDSFWSTNILSPASLREKFDKLYVQMKAKNGTKQSGEPAKKPNNIIGYGG